MGTKLAWAVDRLEADGGPVAPPARDGWDLVLRENVGYLVDDATRDAAFEALRRATGLDPEVILSVPDDLLAAVVVGMRPADRVDRLRRCAELKLAGAPWKAYPGVGRPGVERIELFGGVRAVLALDSNAVRVLLRLGYGTAERSYDATYRVVQTAASAELAPSVASLVRASLLLRRHGQTRCRRVAPSCAGCPVARRCAAVASGLPITDPFAVSPGGRRP